MHGELRARLLPVDIVLQRLLRSDDEVLADVGCGYGFFALPAARRLPRGKVLALDIDPERVEKTRQAAAEAGLTNLEAQGCEPYRFPLADASASAVLLSTVLHDVLDQPRFLREIRRILNPRGRLVVVEFYKVETPFGPPLSIRLAETETQALLREAGFAHQETLHLSEAFYQVVAGVTAGA